MKNQGNNSIRKYLIADIGSVLLIILFTYAACSKVMDYQKFLVELGKSPVLAPFVKWISVFTPAIELAISAALMFRKSQLVALYASFTLMVIFSAYIVTILNFSEYIPCSCGGILENMNWKQHFWFNIGFVFLGGLSVCYFPMNKELIGHKR